MNVVTLCNLIINPVAAPDDAAQGAACAAADELTLPVVRPPSLRRALELEKEATAKVKKALAKGKSKSKIYGYLPMAGAFIDEDPKKGDDQDGGDIMV